MSKIVKVLLWIWCLPQNIIGLLMRVFLDINAFGAINDATYYITDCIKGGVTLGEYIFLGAKASGKALTKYHEYGHVRQSRLLGPFYLIVIGLPSIIRAGLNLYKDYYAFYTESWADKWGGITRNEQGNRVLK